MENGPELGLGRPLATAFFSLRLSTSRRSVFIFLVFFHARADRRVSTMIPTSVDNDEDDDHHPSTQGAGLPGLHVKAHFVVQSGSVVHWRQKNREKKRKKRKKIDKRKEKQKKEEKEVRKLQRFSPFSMQFCLFSINLYYSDSSFCRAARLCRALEDQ